MVLIRYYAHMLRSRSSRGHRVQKNKVVGNSFLNTYPKEFLVHPVRGCTHLIEQGSYQTSLERWNWFSPFPISSSPIRVKLFFSGIQTSNFLPNALTEFTSVVGVVGFYWPDLLNEFTFSPLLRLFSHAVWDCAASHSASAKPPTGGELMKFWFLIRCAATVPPSQMVWNGTKK